MYIKAEKKSLLIIGEILVRYLHNENCSTFDLYNLFCGFSVQSSRIHPLACRILVLVYMHASCCKDMIVTRLAVTCYIFSGTVKINRCSKYIRSANFQYTKRRLMIT